MARLPIRQQNAPYGTVNTVVPVGARARPMPIILQRGAAQQLEQFSSPDIPAPVARALNQMQRNIQDASGPARANPFLNGNLLENVTLQNGGSNGATPNVLAHGLGIPYRGYFILAVRGGYLNGHAAVAPTAALPAAQYIQLWTLFTAFAGMNTALDVWVYG